MAFNPQWRTTCEELLKPLDLSIGWYEDKIKGLWGIYCHKPISQSEKVLPRVTFCPLVPASPLVPVYGRSMPACGSRSSSRLYAAWVLACLLGVVKIGYLPWLTGVIIRCTSWWRPLFLGVEIDSRVPGAIFWFLVSAGISSIPASFGKPRLWGSWSMRGWILSLRGSGWKLAASWPSAIQRLWSIGCKWLYLAFL